MNRVTLRSATWSDLDQAMAWYEKEKAGLASEFLDEVEATLRQVAYTNARFSSTCGACQRASSLGVSSIARANGLLGVAEQGFGAGQVAEQRSVLRRRPKTSGFAFHPFP